jgi:hypothetical protein
MAAAKRHSYAWARHLDASRVASTELSAAAAEGLAYALELAEDAYERSRDPRRWLQLEPLTLAQLAREHGVPGATIGRRIQLARRQLFGALSDAAIYKRLQRQRARAPRSCAQPGCTATIPVAAPGQTRYCRLHAAGKERVRRHRRFRRAAAQEPPANAATGNGVRIQPGVGVTDQT